MASLLKFRTILDELIGKEISKFSSTKFFVLTGWLVRWRPGPIRRAVNQPPPPTNWWPSILRNKTKPGAIKIVHYSIWIIKSSFDSVYTVVIYLSQVLLLELCRLGYSKTKFKFEFPKSNLLIFNIPIIVVWIFCPYCLVRLSICIYCSFNWQSTLSWLSCLLLIKDKWVCRWDSKMNEFLHRIRNKLVSQ